MTQAIAGHDYKKLQLSESPMAGIEKNRVGNIVWDY
jgi:hypothetical protein